MHLVALEPKAKTVNCFVLSFFGSKTIYQCRREIKYIFPKRLTSIKYATFQIAIRDVLLATFPREFRELVTNKVNSLKNGDTGTELYYLKEYFVNWYSDTN